MCDIMVLEMVYCKLLNEFCNNIGIMEGLKKTRLFIHILWISVLPSPPLIHVGGFYNNIIKCKYYPHRLTNTALCHLHPKFSTAYPQSTCLFTRLDRV